MIYFIWNDFLIFNFLSTMRFKKILIKVKCKLKERPIDNTTDILRVAFDLFNGKDIENHFCLRFLIFKNIFKYFIYFITTKFNSRLFYHRFCVEF